MAFLISHLRAEVLGTLKFFQGNVEYKDSPNSALIPATLNMPVHRNGVLKTGLAAKAEISFNNGSHITLEQNKTAAISKLFEDANAKGSWSDKMKRQLNNLSLPKDREASSVAGIRRSEVVLQQQSDYYWEVEEAADIETALSLYDQKRYSDAIVIFNKVIEQSPLSKEAEVSHMVLALIYEEQGDKPARERHIAKLRSDFPNSRFLEGASDK
jgi:tetratricopeptide (TPR) repeat protein